MLQQVARSHGWGGQVKPAQEKISAPRWNRAMLDCMHAAWMAAGLPWLCLLVVPSHRLVLPAHGVCACMGKAGGLRTLPAPRLYLAVAVLTPPDRGARCREVVFTMAERSLSASASAFSLARDADLSAFSAPLLHTTTLRHLDGRGHGAAACLLLRSSSAPTGRCSIIGLIADKRA